MEVKKAGRLVPVEYIAIWTYYQIIADSVDININIKYLIQLHFVPTM